MNLRSFAFLAVLASSAARAEFVYAIDSRAVLTTFDTDRPAAVQSMVIVRGLQPGEQIIGLDFRPANKRLYGLGSYSRLYVIDPVTGFATQIGEPLTTALEGSRFGFSFNPTVDRIRVTSDTGQNLRLHPDTGAVAAVDGRLNYSDSKKPSVVASAYTNSIAGATTTMLYNFDLNQKALVIQNPPNDGTLTVAIQIPAAADFSDLTALDISAETGKAYLATREFGAARTQLYEADLTAKTVTLVGTLGVLDQITAMTIAPAGTLTPLFDRLGGLDAISAVIDEFLGNVVGDNRINGFFGETVKNPARVQSLRQNLIDQVCAGSGGPCQYKGGDMKSVHRGMKIDDDAFDALVDDLVKALDKFKVPATEKVALLGVLAPMRGDIVEARQMKILKSVEK